MSALSQEASPQDDISPASIPALTESSPSALPPAASTEFLLPPDSTDVIAESPMPLTSYQAADLLNMAALLPSELAATADYPPESDANERAIAQAEPAPPSAPERFGAVGQNYWYVQAGPSISFDPDDDGFAAFGLAGAGITDFFAHGHSINLELNKLKFIQPGDDAVGLNLGLILRWHFVREDTWSLYVDGGAGFLVTSEDVPAEGGSQFNFTPQVGGGATFRMRDQEHLMVGLRWHHISNAELYPPNPGRDSILLYVGYMWPR
ncbi:acyloxyacyl hydrolase [Leptolyngbya sp. O-77]|uniref:acyloxyacyl hydrolase n=1 Tax=Leptolyngbya sp. O-77 TaxID=1080068 RepID=UPI000A817868|nr:acyloxyacyl hydrolase [Leptolyngbya sp. O-77]